MRRGGVVVGIALAAVIAILVAVTRFAPPAVVPADGLHVVTTTPVLYSLTAQVLGSTEQLVNLVPPGASPENYALRPRDANALSRADVIVRVGLGFEQFLADTYAGAERRGVAVITASDGIPTVGDPRDPHLWTDPLRAVRLVENIAAGLAARQPAHAAAYQRNAAAAIERLRALDDEFRAPLAAVPEKRFLAFHPAWGYLAERYGLEQVAAVEEVPGREPTARELAALVARLRTTGVKAVFSEPQISPRIVEVLARDLGLTVYEVNPEGGELTPQGYERLMRENVATFVRALRASE